MYRFLASQIRLVTCSGKVCKICAVNSRIPVLLLVIRTFTMAGVNSKILLRMISELPINVVVSSLGCLVYLHLLRHG